MKPNPTRAPSTDGRVADAAARNWVDHRAPRRVRGFLRLSRLDRPIGTWLLLLPCWWGLALAIAASGEPRPFDLWIALGCGVGAVLMRGAGCTWNDLTDRDFDAAVARTRSRPLPSGQVGVTGATVWMIAQALVAFLVLLTFPGPAIALGVASLALVCIYPFAKRFTWWPQVFLGLAFNWGVLLAYAAHAREIAVSTVLLYLSGIAWTLFYDTIYAHQDKEDDALIGVKSTARLFGDRTTIWLTGFATVSTLCAAAAVVLAFPAGLPAVVALAAVGAFALHLAWQLARLAPDDPNRCLELFRSNRDAGLILAAGLAGGALLTA
jgi:4-hydroxybenzoate polyprenyltransferase